MSRARCAARAALLCSALAAAQPSPVALWPASFAPGALPGDNGFVAGPEALVTTVGPYASSRRYYNVSIPTLTPFLVSNGTGACVVVGPGGGYGHLAWDDEGLRVAARLNAGGVSAVVLKYRVPARPPAAGAPAVLGLAQLMDAQRAMGLVRARAAAWGLNASRVGFLGFSAGGHLTAHLSTAWAARAYARVDAADDLPCRPDFSVLMYPWKLLLGDNRSATALAPELVVTRDHPPSMIAQNLDDTTAWPENSMVYARALALAGAPAGVVHLYPNGGHGFGVCAELDPVGGFEMCCEWVGHALRFLQRLGMAPGWPANITQGV